MLEKKARGHMVGDDKQPIRKMNLNVLKGYLLKYHNEGGVNPCNIEKECGKIQEKSALERLNELSGLNDLKKFVSELSDKIKRNENKSNAIVYNDRLKKRSAEGIAIDRDYWLQLHIALKGNPGTGKTTIAKLIGDIYRELGILPIGSVTKVVKADLVAGYSGQTALKTRRVIEDAIGGVLFLDEAYTLVNNPQDSFGMDARDTLLEAMSDRSGEFAVIIAGYPDLMNEFIRSNPGLTGRFKTQITIDDYSPEVLAKIYKKKVNEYELIISDNLESILERFFECFKNNYNNYTDGDWNNARHPIQLAYEMKDECKKHGITEADICHIPQKYHKYIPKEFHKYLPEEYQKMLEEQKPKTNLPSQMTISQLKLPQADIFKTDGGIDIKKMEQAIIFITTTKTNGEIVYGTGFLISPNGHFLTCNHVIEDARNIKPRTRITKDGIREDKDDYKCELMSTSNELDVALLKLDGIDLPYLNIEKDYIAYEYEKGSEVCLSGYPFGKRTASDCSYNPGTISAILSDYEPECVNLDISGKCGNSGSPVLDMKTGSVIGIFRGSMDEGEKKIEEINYMRPIKYFWKNFVR
jgi:V8-like Glu-specific endopeptidase